MIEGLPFIASSALSVAGTLFEGISKYNASIYNSMVAQKQAAQKAEEMKYNEEMQRRSYARLQGENIASAAKSGLTLDSFSDAMHDSDLEFERDILSQKYSAASEISALNSSARMKKKEGKNSLISSYLGAGSDTFKSFDRYNDLY